MYAICLRPTVCQRWASVSINLLVLGCCSSADLPSCAVRRPLPEVAAPLHLQTRSSCDFHTCTRGARTHAHIRTHRDTDTDIDTLSPSLRTHTPQIWGVSTRKHNKTSIFEDSPLKFWGVKAHALQIWGVWVCRAEIRDSVLNSNKILKIVTQHFQGAVLQDF